MKTVKKTGKTGKKIDNKEEGFYDLPLLFCPRGRKNILTISVKDGRIRPKASQLSGEVAQRKSFLDYN